MERRNNYAVILKELGCFIKCAKFEQVQHNPKFLGFHFWFVWFSGCLQTKKNSSKKLKKRIYQNKCRFRSLHTLLQLFSKYEGNAFSTNI